MTDESKSIRDKLVNLRKVIIEMFYMVLCIILLPIMFIIILICRPFKLTYSNHLIKWKIMEFIEYCCDKALNI